MLLCIHGYGESAASFSFLGDQVEEDFTLLAIDLPHHGETAWEEGLYFTPDHLLEIIDMITKEQMISRENMYLMGYSLGGRIVLHLLQRLAEKTGRVLLLAPDGLRLNLWYWLATHNKAGNDLFRFTMRHPNWFFAMIRAGKLLNLGNQSVYKFVNQYLEDGSLREELYRRWTCLCKFRPDLKKIRRLIADHSIPVRLIYGRHDRIIRYERGEKFRHGIESSCTIMILPTGHQLLLDKYCETIVRLLKD
jgi:pimeloyl-ACP methyl ester carboxylesterase